MTGDIGYQYMLLGLVSVNLGINIWVMIRLFFSDGSFDFGRAQKYDALFDLHAASGAGESSLEAVLPPSIHPLASSVENNKTASSSQTTGHVGGSLVRESGRVMRAIPQDNTNLLNGDGKVAQVDHFNRANHADPTSEMISETHAQSHSVASNHPDNINNAQRSAQNGDTKSDPPRPIHASASLSKESPACPCNLLL